jgi:hypothetical protein
METPESIERMLKKRLVPSAFSVKGSSALESLIDELAEESAPSSVKLGRYLSVAAAAAMVMFVGILISNPSGEVPAVAGLEDLFAEPQDVVLVEDVEGVISAEENEGLVADKDGSLHRAWHVQVVSEERFHDEKSGEEVRVVYPRDELVLMPVTSF